MYKVLIVDDNEQYCELLKDVLTNWGYQVYAALQGIEALTMAQQHLPDLILLDVMLPGRNGFEICHELKNNHSTKHIPVVMQTVLDESDDRIRGYKTGASLFMTKPINYGELRHHIERLIQIKKTLENNEERHAVVNTLVNVMGNISPELYRHCAQVYDYCQKAANIMVMDAERKNRLGIAAWLHSFGMMVARPGEDCVQAGMAVLKELKMTSWLYDYLLYHHRLVEGGDLPEEKISEDVWLLAVVNQFVCILKTEQGPKAAFQSFLREHEGKFPAAVVGALDQLIQDELLLSKAFPGKQTGQE